MRQNYQLPCHYCGRARCVCETDLKAGKVRKDLRETVRHAYFNGNKYDKIATAEEVKLLLDIIDAQDRRAEYRKMPERSNH
jgi:hypothetical protein